MNFVGAEFHAPGAGVMNIIFMGSPEFAVPSLEALHASSHQIAAVVTQPDRPSGRKLQVEPSPVKVAAHALGIPVFQPVTTKTPQFLDEIRSFEPDVLIVVAYGEILRPALLGIPQKGAVNLHASLLPKYRGAAPIPWAILNGETVTGVTTMLMDAGMDSGPMLLQERCSIHPGDTTESLSKKLASIGAPLLKKTIDSLEKGDLEAREQDLTAVTYAPKLKKTDGWIDWTRPADWISRQIRAFHPWPGTFTRLNDQQVKFRLANPVAEKTDLAPGTIVAADKRGVLVACGGRTVLHVLDVQPESRPRMTAADFVHGYRIEAGKKFESPAQTTG
jgi:methionyl-tRNA formyltransferase